MKRRYTAAEVPTFVASGVLPAYVENIVSRDDVAVGALWPKGPPARLQRERLPVIGQVRNASITNFKSPITLAADTCSNEYEAA